MNEDARGRLPTARAADERTPALPVVFLKGDAGLTETLQPGFSPARVRVFSHEIGAYSAARKLRPSSMSEFRMWGTSDFQKNSDISMDRLLCPCMKRR